MNFGEWDNGSVEVSKLMEEFKRILVPGGTLVIFYDIFKIGELKEIAERVGFKQPRIGFWRKTNPVPINARVNYLSNAREYFLSVTKGVKRTFNSYCDTAEYNYPIVHGKERIHPTQKPVGLMKDIIEANTNIGDVVMDPFFGSGATIKAAAMTGRGYIGIEKDEKYYQQLKEQF